MMDELTNMVADFCGRTGGRFSVQEVLSHAQGNIPYADDDGFFILSVGHNTLYVDFLYIVPGRSKDILQRYFELINDIAEHHMVQYIQTIARRSGVEKLYPEVMKPVATVYEFDRKGGGSHGWRIDDKNKPNNQGK